MCASHQYPCLEAGLQSQLKTIPPEYDRGYPGAGCLSPRFIFFSAFGKTGYAEQRWWHLSRHGCRKSIPLQIIITVARKWSHPFHVWAAPEHACRRKKILPRDCFFRPKGSHNPGCIYSPHHYVQRQRSAFC